MFFLNKRKNIENHERKKIINVIGVSNYKKKQEFCFSPCLSFETNSIVDIYFTDDDILEYIIQKVKVKKKIRLPGIYFIITFGAVVAVVDDDDDVFCLFGTKFISFFFCKIFWMMMMKNLKDKHCMYAKWQKREKNGIQKQKKRVKI